MSMAEAFAGTASARPPSLLTRWFDHDDNPLERTKTRVLLFILLLSVVGEIGLILIDLTRGSSVTNNVTILVFAILSLAALARGRKVLAAYLIMIPFAVDFFRAFFTGGGIQTHALPLFFLLTVESLYFLPTRHALAFIATMLLVMNIDVPLGLSERFAIPEAVEAAQSPERRFVVTNAIAIAMTAIFATVFFFLNKYFRQLQHQNEHLDDLVRARTAELDAERQRSESLLLNILPESVADRLKRSDADLVDDYPSASVLFADIVGFTPLSKTMSAQELVDLLNRTFSAVDALVEAHGLEKIKTIGDAYMVASGLPDRRDDHLERLADFAVELRELVHGIRRDDHGPLDMRIGLNAGPVVAGVIGTRKFMYDLWGETVNTASRMESSGVSGRIQVTATVRDALNDRFNFERRGPIEVKGLGQVDTFFLEGRLDPNDAPPVTPAVAHASG